MNRRNIALVLVVASLVGLELLLGRGEGLTPLPRAVFSELSPAGATTLRIVDGERSVELVRAPGDGERWHVRERYDFPAHAPAVRAFLTHFVSLRSDDRVGTEPASHERFGVGAGAARVTVLDAAGRELVDAWVGRARTGDGQRPAVGSHVRPVSGDEVYRAAALAEAPADARRWLDARVVAFDLAAVRAVTLEGAAVGDAPRHLMREEDGRWGIAGSAEKLLPAAVDPVLLFLANLYLQDVVGIELEPEGLGVPHWSVELDLGKDARAVGLVVGAPTSGEDPRVLSSQSWGAPWVATVDANTGRRLEQALRSLLE